MDYATNNTTRRTVFSFDDFLVPATFYNSATRHTVAKGNQGKVPVRCRVARSDTVRRRYDVSPFRVPPDKRQEAQAPSPKADCAWDSRRETPPKVESPRLAGDNSPLRSEKRSYNVAASKRWCKPPPNSRLPYKSSRPSPPSPLHANQGEFPALPSVAAA